MSNMNQYDVAPLEGITGYVFRDIHHRHFPGVRKYYIPFIEPKPNAKKIFTGRELGDILPEHNEGIPVVPQILTNKWEDFLWTAGHLQEYGYTEINWNVGCPAKTVVSKNRGSGFLAFPEEIDEFLYRVIEKTDLKISVKTRIGRDTAEEFDQLLEIYEKYPLEELVVHPRTQKDFYGNTPDLDAFEKAANCRKFPIIYNGDIQTAEDLNRIQMRFPDIMLYMMGRGVLRNPQLIENLQQGTLPDKQRIWDFLEDLKESYSRELSGETVVLFKLKEIWCYMIKLFDNPGKLAGKLRKAKHLSDYELAARSIFEECEIKENDICSNC